MIKSLILGTMFYVVYSFIPVDNVRVTGYCPGPPCVDPKWADGMTAAGTPARRGVCAADWDVFPKGTVFFVPQYGKCRVEDTGSAVKGKHIDLYFDTYDEAVKWGSKYMRIYRMGKEDVR